jgi:hypothetical protein
VKVWTQEKVDITQLEVEKQAKHTITHEIYNAVLPETAYTPMVIEKSESVMLRLKEIADVGFSPSALTVISGTNSVLFSEDIANQGSRRSRRNIALNTWELLFMRH